MTKDTFINSFGEKMTREKPDDGRIRCGDYGILCAHWISQTPKELHQPLIHVFISVNSQGDYDDDEHLRRLIEVNIPRGDERDIKAAEKWGKRKLKKYYDVNFDCNVQIGVLDDLLFLLNTNRKIIRTIKERKASNGKKKDIRGLNS